MPLNLSAQELTAGCTELAGELDLQFWYRENSNRLTLIFESKPGEKLTIYFSLTFPDLHSISPQSVWLDARYGQYMGKTDLYTSPAAITTFAHMEAILRDLYTLKDEVAKIKPRKPPKNKLVTTYDTLNDFLYEKADRNNDMHADGDGFMVLTTYSTDYDDDRSGIDILLHFKIIDPPAGLTVKDNGEDAAIVLMGAEREANDHEWEPYSSKKLPTGKVKTLDDLLELIRKNEQPKKSKP